MTKQEFLTQLQAALSSRLGSKQAGPHVSYYQEYIEIEVRKGRKEEEILRQLGSPRLIARSIIDAYAHTGHGTIGNDIFLKYGKVFKGKCASLCGQTLEKARRWFENL